MASTTINPESKYDYIIVGGGLAGCTLASRLRQGDPSLSVLIIEAGTDPKDNPIASAALGSFAAHYSDLDWAYKTVEQPHLENRSCYTPSGKALSGGSATNYGTWTRGSVSDYDRWANLVGDARWSYEGMLPYFRKTEHHHDSAADPHQHGFAGPIHNITVSASSPNRKYPLRDDIRAAWASVGVSEIKDANSGSPLGLSELVENWHDGKRQLASQAYDLTGVAILTDTMVQSIIVEDQNGEKVATGIKLAGDSLKTIHATKEIILSAGAYRTPQLLMLSGIGPDSELSKHNIPQIINSPDVGQNLHDHLVLWQWWKLRHPERGQSMGTPLWTDPSFQLGKPVDWVVFQQTPRAQLEPTLPPQHPLLNPQSIHTETMVLYVASGPITGMALPFDGTYISSVVMATVPESRGAITLSSSSVTDGPVIDPNFYDAPADRAMLRAGVRQITHVLLDTPEGQSVVEKEVFPDGCEPLSATASDEEVDRRVRKLAQPIWHPAGTAAMGKVVDSECRVIGVQGLRVVDSSVLPMPIAAHYQVAIYALAEQAADIILGRQS